MPGLFFQYGTKLAVLTFNLKSLPLYENIIVTFHYSVSTIYFLYEGCNSCRGRKQTANEMQARSIVSTIALILPE